MDDAVAATQAEILDAQEMLIALGYDPGTADGFMGSRNRNAIRAFQSDMGMSMTGVVDLNLLNNLDLEVRAAGVSTGSGVDAVDYAQWLEDLTFQAENSGSADSWVFDELYLIADGLYAVGRGVDFSGYILDLEDVTFDAERNSDAAPWVVDELYALIDDYYMAQPQVQAWIWPITVIATDFRNAGNPANAGLLLDAGNFYIDRNAGLVSQPEDLDADDGDMNGEELAFAILGALLDDSSHSSVNNSSKNGGNSGSGELAQGHISTEFTNAFAIDIVASARNADQPFVIGAFFDRMDSPGYRIAFEPGRGGEVAILLCTGNNNLSMVANAWTSVDLADGRPHSIQWTRNWFGDMELFIDGDLVIQANDTYMNDWFAGVILQSHGGNWALESLYLSDDS
ncbi:MAG: peptidoglycan-binding protein [Rhodospirillaceae bacterium]|nr:peptidoglycan-binding protein [Rhodospirillaceae bacterium]MBT6204219.1 peptidoglycan-binding protein [Rhodospirillaceae bacterium]MBT6509933.1 peptidoglycan-binding protein [Rhodospirillaceae bacterium]MBT7613052.1 peptidoglycan-binding protein [Rhodospirillaceae bacterium]